MSFFRRAAYDECAEFLVGIRHFLVIIFSYYSVRIGFCTGFSMRLYSERLARNGDVVYAVLATTSRFDSRHSIARDAIFGETLTTSIKALNCLETWRQYGILKFLPHITAVRHAQS